MTKNNLEWLFPPSPAKPVGYNSGGLSHFSADRDAALFRECLQNSLDADDGKQAVLVGIDMVKIPLAQIGRKTLAIALRQSIESKYNSDTGRQQFQAAFEMLDQPKIPTLSITDLETVGAPDYDPESGEVGPWEAMTNSEGHSVKPSGDKLGSFGLGKHAPFVTTPLRTVLYSTCYPDQEQESGYSRRFIGRSILVTHFNSDLVQLSPDGYLGDECNPLSDNDIPEFFKLNKPGTRVLIPGYSPGGEEDDFSWEIRALNAAADNFFFAIIKKRLELSIGAGDNGFTIDAETIKVDGDCWSKIEDPRTRKYIEVSSFEPVAECYIEGIGDLELRLDVGEKNERRSLALVRHPGLKLTDIAQHLGEANPPIPHHWHPFTAVVSCVPREHDEVFQNCEPPSHDRLSVEEIPPTNKEGRKKARGALRELRDWLYDCIEKYASPQQSEVDSSAHELEEFGLVIEDSGSGTKIRLDPIRVLNRAPRDEVIRSSQPVSEQDVEQEDEEGEEMIVPDSGEENGGSEQGSEVKEGNVAITRANRIELAPRFRPVFSSSGERETHQLIVSFSAEHLSSSEDNRIAFRAVGEDEARDKIILMQAICDGIDWEIDGNIFVIPKNAVDQNERVVVHLTTNEPIGKSAFSLSLVI